MKLKKFLNLFFLLIISCFFHAKDNVDKIRINQLGYLVNSPKIFIAVDTKAVKFNITDKNNKSVYSGELIDNGIYTESGENIKTGDFSSFNISGEYKIFINDLGKSYSFKIDNNVYVDLLKATVKGYYYQRASMDLDEKHAGKWKRKLGHPDINLLFRSLKSKAKKYSSPGGWYDAGDYGKYVVNAGISVCTLLGLYELYPDIIKDDLNIPESGNNQSDLIDELKYEIDWLKTMQDNDGGVFFKIGPIKWPGFIMPANDTDQRYVIGKSTTSTLNFCAVMAQAGRIFKSINSEFSIDCINRAKSAWIWANNNPNIFQPNETGGTGAYDDNNFKDEFFWAASELFITTGKDEYKEYILNNINDGKITAQATWKNVSNLGVFSLAVTKNNLPIESQNDLKQNIISYANIILKDIEDSGYKIPMKEKDFIWGSNGEICNYGVILCYAYKLTGDKKYLDSDIMILDYILGKNATGYSFVTGHGSKTPIYIHHRISGSDNIKEPVPGLLAGGPNKNRQDNMNYACLIPAQCYIDTQGSFASNEISINWNAPLVFILGFIEKNKDVYLK